MDDLEIPLWMDQEAPGAAEAARLVWSGKLSDAQRERLQRLTSDDTRPAWHELHRKHSSKKLLSDDEMRNAQLHLLNTAFSAADFPPISDAEIAERKANLAKIGVQITEAASNFRPIADDIRLDSLWQLYRFKRGNDRLLEILPDELVAIAGVLERIGDFCDRASKLYKPEGPVPPVGKPHDREAAKTTVIRAITEECEKWFGTSLYSTVATLANASLGRKDITRAKVRGSLQLRNGPIRS
jgi:hypothetical protein